MIDSVVLGSAKTRPLPNFGERPFKTCIAVIKLQLLNRSNPGQKYDEAITL